jgi:tetratricopeptide (TPR) repeat protein
MRRGFLFFCQAMLLSLVLGISAHAQRQGPPQPLPAGAIANNGSIYVKVLAESGSALDSEPNVVLTTGGLDGPVTGLPTQVSQSEWQFQGLQVGTEYVIRIEAKGFRAENRHVTLPAFDNASVRVDVYLVPLARPSNAFSPPPGHFLLSPRAQREVQQAIKDLNSRKYSKSRKHLEEALKMAPRHPGVNYLMGLSYLRDHQAALAIPYLKKSLSVDPSQSPVVLALGIALYEQQDYAGAVDLLNKAIATGLSSWQAHWVLAGCYLRESKYELARQQAEKALEIGKKDASRAQVVLGQALAGLGRNQQAIEAFEAFLKKNSHDPEARNVRAEIARLREPAKTPVPPKTPERTEPATEEKGTMAFASSGGSKSPVPPPAPATMTTSAPVPPPKMAERVPKENWAPPDVDATRPEIVSNAACHLSALLKNAGRSMADWVKDLQEFTATEDYQSVEIAHNGQVEQPFEQKFDYLVFIHKPRPKIFDVQEQRRPTPIPSRMGAPIIALGSPALALVFHPIFAQDYKWSCDGLGEWEGEPAWIVRFAQSADRPTATLQSFNTPTSSSLLPIKGIAWLSKNGDHVMHLETDLLKPMPLLRLERQHFSIDYRLVSFRSHPVTLWLPESVDLYIRFKGHSYHNYSRYSHFLLFWTGSKQKIGAKTQSHQPR